MNWNRILEKGSDFVLRRVVTNTLPAHGTPIRKSAFYPAADDMESNVFAVDGELNRGCELFLRGPVTLPVTRMLCDEFLRYENPCEYKAHLRG
jgi:hypothetical protein